MATLTETTDQFRQVMESSGSTPGVLTPQDLRTKLVTPRFFSELINQTVWPDRAAMLARIRRADIYYRGLQYSLPWSTQNGITQFVSGTGSTLSLKTGARDSNALDYVMNIYRGDLRKFTAVLGQRSPNVKAQPMVKGNPQQQERARLGNLVASYLHDLWKADEAHRSLVHKLGKSGPVFGYTPFTVNGQAYGTTSVPRYGNVKVDGRLTAECPGCGGLLYEEELETGENGFQCPDCGGEVGPENLSREEGEEGIGIESYEDYENGVSELHLCTTLTVTTPLKVKDTGLKDCPWLRYEYWEDKGTLIAAYPELRDPAILRKVEGKMGGWTDIGQAEQKQAQEQSESRSNVGTTPYQYGKRWLYTCLWLKPAAYYQAMMALGGWDQDRLDFTNSLTSQYPNGMKLVLVNGYLIKVIDCDLCSEWTVCKSDEGDTIHTDAIFEDYIQAQDQVNDIFNMLIETVMRGLPVTLFDPEVLDADYIRNRGQMVQELIPAKPSVGSSNFSNSFYKLDLARFEPELVAFMEKVIERYREIIGILPALFGGGGPEPTARAAEIKRNQALQQLNTVWNQCRTFWERVYYNAALQQARYSPFRGYVPVTAHDEEQENYIEFGDLTPLLKGGWSYSADESTPMTAGQRRDFIREVMGQTDPDTKQVLGLYHPDNVESLNEAFGLNGYTVPGASERRHLSTVIYQLMNSEPIPSVDPMTGQPTTEPSIPYDPFVFRPDRTVDSIQEWLHSDEAMRVEGMPGYDNVVAFGKAAEAILNPPSAPMGPDGMGGGGGGGGPEEEATGGGRPEDLAAPPPDGLAPMDPGLIAEAGPGAPGPVEAALPPQ